MASKTPPEWLIENKKDGTLLALIPGGECLVGDPAFKVTLPAYYLALHPVTNAQYARFKSAHQFATGTADHPVVNVNWDDAQAYCRWAGLRLPSELEWEKGARGVDGRVYPWGNEWQNGQHCRWDKNKGSETTCGVWSYPEGCTPWGLYGMSGNVWEWCADWYDDDAYTRYKQGDLTPPSSGGARVLRGGSWVNGDEDRFRGASGSTAAARRGGTTSAASVVPGLCDYALLFYSFPGYAVDCTRH